MASAVQSQTRDAEKLLAQYGDAFRTYYQRDANRLVADRYGLGEDDVETGDVAAALLGRSAAFLVQGPTGCGKTLLARRIAIDVLAKGHVPIVFPANAFGGRLQEVLNTEVTLLEATSARDLLRACRLRGRQIVLLADGLNECVPGLQDLLMRNIRAFSSRYGARVVLTSQARPDRIDLLCIETLNVRPPSTKLKELLANLPSTDVPSIAAQLLETASSGLEAVLIGEAGSRLPAGASRFALFDSFARLRLAPLSSEGVALLCAFAGTLVSRASFGLSIREYDRLASAQGFERDVKDAVMRSKLLELRGDRVTFIHELFLESFTAEFALRNTPATPAALLETLRLPRYQASKEFIVGGIEEEAVLHGVLAESTDPDILRACTDGACGQSAERWAMQELERFISAMTQEASGIRFEMSDSGFQGYAIVPDTILVPPNSTTLIPALWRALMRGKFIPEILHAVGLMDTAVNQGIATHREAGKANRRPAKHGIFAEAYVGSRKAGVSQIVGCVHGGGFFPRPAAAAELSAALLAGWASARSAGQFYILIGLSKFSEEQAAFAPWFSPLVEKLRVLPYHLQLDVIGFCLYMNDAAEPYRTNIIQGLEESLNFVGPLMNGLVFEALGRLGALGEAEHEYAATVRQELAEIFANEGHEANQAAWGFYSRQFDHPFSSAYFDEVNNMSNTDKIAFLKKACQGAEPSYLWFLGPLLRDLGKSGDTSACAAIDRWAQLPERTHFMPQEAMEVFWEAHKALGKLGGDLPAGRSTDNSPEAQAIVACADLIYWSARPDISNAPTSPHTAAARDTLLAHADRASAGALSLTELWMMSADGKCSSLLRTYPAMAVQVCRRALEYPGEQISFQADSFVRGADSISAFCLRVLGSFGGATDLALLRRFHDHATLGVIALREIRELESRTLYAR